jgi:hypothetical protein
MVQGRSSRLSPIAENVVSSIPAGQRVSDSSGVLEGLPSGLDHHRRRVDPYLTSARAGDQSQQPFRFRSITLPSPWQGNVAWHESAAFQKGAMRKKPD